VAVREEIHNSSDGVRIFFPPTTARCYFIYIRAGVNIAPVFISVLPELDHPRAGVKGPA
jgi:hypothetical protein